MARTNVGARDRWIRTLAGLGIISLAFWGPQSTWAWLGVAPLATGYLRYCPAYSLLGLSTASLSGKSKN